MLLLMIIAGCGDRVGITYPPVTTTPAVSSTNPANNSINVPFNQNLTATFSEVMDSFTITTATFTLMQGSSFVSGTVSYTGTTATFEPASNLSPNTEYTATLTTGAKNLAGNAPANNCVWTFTTGAAAAITPPTVSSTDPVNAATSVPFNQKIAATFSTAMDAATFTSATFTLRQGTTSVSGFVSYSGTTAIFAPSTNLAPNTAYTATITIGVKDLADNALAGNHVWSFTTGAAAVVTPPTTSLTNPENGGIDVPFNQKIVATFSKTMDAATFTSATFTLRQGTTSVSGFVSYSGTTATFAPAGNLSPSTVYTATITTGVKDLANNALANDYVWSFTTGIAAVVTPPTVSSTDPANTAMGVAFNQRIAVTFSTVMDAETFTLATFTLMQGTTSVSGFVSYSGTTAIFAPASNLLPNTVYTATITTGVKDLAENALAVNHVWSFTTGAAAVVTPPTVSSTDPASAAIDVAFNQRVAATFSKTMNAATITTGTFTLMQGTTSVSGFVSYSGTTAIFAPSVNLAPNTIYTATITTGAKDLADNALAADFVWSFTTGATAVVTPPTVSSTDPASAAVGVAFNQKVAATFSKTMNASTINTATFTLMQGATSVSGFVSYSGTTALYSPAANLAANTVYTATITTGARDLAGNPLASNLVWSFTTGAAAVVTPPTVGSTDPANADTGVAFNQTLAAVFSKTMDATTITTATFTLMQGTTPVSAFVSYSGLTALLSPSSNLTPNTVYTATITTGAKDLAGNALVSNLVWNFTTGAAAVVTPPTVSSTDPASAAVGVAFNQKVAATFSKTMNASTINTATFTLMQGTTSVSGFVSYSGTTALYSPASNLLPNTVYTATITTGARDLAGNALASDRVWSFTTGAAAVVTPPTVSSTDPASAAVGVVFNQKISALFSKTMDATTITTATFTLMQGSTPVSGFVSYSGVTALLSPYSNLTPNTVYTATITTGAKDLAGNALASNRVWSFTTGAAPIVTPPVVRLTVPVNAASSIALNQIITANFSKPMNTLTITTSTFTLKKGTTSVSGFVSYSDTTATFEPSSNLLANTVYTARITVGAKDLEGNALTKDTAWSFTTVQMCTVTVIAVNGSVAKNPNLASYNLGAAVQLTATPATGYNFTAWSVDTTGSTNPFTVTLNNNKNFTANFTIKTYTLAVVAVNGTVTKNPLQATYDHGDTVALTATPAIGYTFTGWSGDGSGTANPLDVVMNSNKNITANFIVAPYRVTLVSNPANGGNLYGASSYNPGTLVTVVTSSKDGYRFVNWTAGTSAGPEVSTNASYTFPISQDTTLVANFVLGMASVDLGSAGDFAVLAGSGVTNTGANILTHVYGDVGSFPTSTMNIIAARVTGTLYLTADPIVSAAKDALTTAFNDAQARALDAISLPGQVGGLTLAPGLYVNGSSSGISGTGANAILTLDAKGDANATWVFKMSTTLITDPGTSVVLAGGAQWKNVYWSVGSSATFGTNSIFYGNVLADQSITITTGAVLHGRALTRIAAVTLDGNIVDNR
ncbi:MAG: Ig-like domain-containing protein [Fibrobacterota bacterium]